MMRLLLPLALIGAAPVPNDITKAAICALPRADTEAAFRALPLLSTEDDTEADERGAIYTFRDATVFEGPASGVKFSDYDDPKAGTASQTYEAVGAGEYETMRGTLFSMLPKARCDQESGKSCTLDLGAEGDWRKSMTFSQAESGRIAFTCAFTKAR